MFYEYIDNKGLFYSVIVVHCPYKTNASTEIFRFLLACTLQRSTTSSIVTYMYTYMDSPNSMLVLDSPM